MAPVLPQDATLLDLRGLEPAAQRLLEIVGASAGGPGADLVIDWGGRFPWSVDATVLPPCVFPEEVVAAVARACDPCRLWMLVRSALPAAYTSREAYRHVERARRRSSRDWERALAKLASDLVDDMVSLVPQLYGVVIAPECERDALIEAACAQAGIAARRLPEGPGGAPERRPDDADRTGGIEERLCGAGHPARLDRPFAETHGELRGWRERGWRLVASAHERLIAAEAVGAHRDRDLAEAVRSLGRHLRRVREVRRRFEETYDGLVPDGAVVRLLRGVDLPLREQYGQLSARARAVRTLR
ncbi:MAG: hypothetical protein ACOC6J_00670 [Spirochaetota bacterium]